MAEETKLSSLNFDKLNVDNYHDWEFSMRMFLIGKNLWEIVQGTETLPNDANEETKAKFQKRSNVALATISLGVSKDLQIIVRPAKTPKEAWDLIQTRFVEKTLSKKIFYRRKLYHAQMAPKADMTVHIDQIKMLSQQLEACGDPVSENDLVMILISSWTSDYNNLVTTLETLGEEKLTWTYVRDRAIAECDRISRRKDVQKPDSAFNTRHDGGGFSHGRGSDSGRGRGRGRSSTKPAKKQKQCYKCHEFGHLIRDCPGKKNTDKRDGEDANIAFEGQFDDNDEDGEFAFSAVEVHNVVIGQDDASSSGEIGDADEYDRSMTQHNEAFVAKDTGDKAEVVGNDKPWLLDSGCSRHMTPKKTDFKRYLEFRVPVNVKLADKTTIPGYGIGDIHIKLFDGNEFVPVTIKNVLYVPKLQEKLLSITDMTERGCSVTFEGKLCTLTMKGKTFLFGQRYGKLWRLNNCEGEECFFTAASDFCTNNVSLELWHQRYGHLSYGNLDILHRKDMVEGLRGIDPKNPPCEKCEGCIMGKHCRSPFPKKSLRVTTKPLELLHSDVCGPMSVDSIGGSRYFITFIDDYSRFVVTYTMKRKDEALDKFKEYVAMAETKFGYKVMKTRNDNGGEYCSKSFEDYLKERGTQDERTAPYTPQQNGTAERMNRTLMEKVRSMLHHSKLPLRFWAEALMVATHVRNCSPTCTFDETPYERWYKEKPDVSNLRVFGCKAYARIPDEKRKKLDPKSQQCIFVGYPAGVKGYKLYDPVKRKMIVRRDVIFIENIFDHSIENKGEPDELLPAICLDFDYDDDEDNDDDVRDATRNAENREEIDDAIRENVTEEAVHDDAQDTRDRPRRNVNPIDRYGTVATHRFGHWEVPDEVHMAVGPGSDDPRSYREAMNGPNSTLWKTAAEVEIESVLKNRTWDLVDLPPDKTAIGSKWVFKTKRNADGTINKHKARLVAQGYAQQHGIDYEETFAPVVKYVSLRTVLAIANQHNMEVHQMDVNSAYLNGDIDAEIYMKQPEGFIDPNNPHKVCKLRKGLYGLKQGGRIWNAKIDNYLKSQGYTPSDADPCIYVKHKKGKMVVIALYVDDTVIASNCNDLLKSAKTMLSEKFDMTDLGEVESILGMSIKRDRKIGILTISQSAYLQSVLERFGMADCNPVSTPMEPGKHYEKTPDNEEGLETREFQALIGSLVYASIATRPDISEAVGKLSQHMSRPNNEHWAAAKRVLRYIKGTLKFGLKFERSNNFELIGYSDADWAGDVDTRKSTSGYSFMLGKATIAWASKKQSVVALSTTEAEYIALCSATQEAVWLRRLLGSLRQGQARPTTVHEDNRGAISLSKNPKDHARTKHIDIKYHYVRDAVQKNYINVEHCETKRMIADTLTKGLPKPAFEQHRNAMNIGAC